MSDHDSEPPRRDFLRKSLALIPIATFVGSGVGLNALAIADGIPAAEHIPVTRVDDYRPGFFFEEEWRFVQAAVARLIPADDLGPGALEAGAAEFIDRQMSTPYARGALWYMQGPFVTDAVPEMGYQLQLVPQQLYRIGIAAMDQWCKANYGDVFAAKDSATRDVILKRMEAGDVELDGVPVKAFFSLLLQNTREGFLSDPIHGGNKGMVGWALVGFPGARADFMDWVERNEAYPFPPVSIRGERA